MVHLTKRLVFVVVALFYTSVVTAAPCQVSSAPTVSVDIRRDEVREVVDTSRDELERLATAAGKQDHRPVWDPRKDFSQCMQQHKILSTSRRHLISARTHRAFMASAMMTWREVVAAA